MNEGTHEWTKNKQHELTNEWMNKHIDEWTNEWIKRWLYNYLLLNCSFILSF